MRAWARGHLLGLAAAVRRLARAPLATLLNAVAIGAAMALPLGAWVLVKNAERLAGHLGAAPQLSVFLATDAVRADAARVEAAAAAAPGVRGVRFVPKDEALVEMKRVEGLGDIAAALGSNPLPDAVVVELAPGDATAGERLAASLRGLPKVAQVQLDSAWIRRLEALLRLGTVGVALVAALLAFGLVAITFNTVRLQILTQRVEIEVSKLVGATDAAIRRPFLYQGVLAGLAGGAVAVAAVGGSIGLLNGEVARVAAAYGAEYRLALPTPADLAAILAFASALGWSGAWLSVSKHLADIRPK